VTLNSVNSTTAEDVLDLGLLTLIRTYFPLIRCERKQTISLFQSKLQSVICQNFRYLSDTYDTNNSAFSK